MAHLTKQERRPYGVQFRYAGQKFHRSLGTSDRTDAEGLVKEIEENLDLIKRGKMPVPIDCSAETFWAIVSTGNRVASERKILARKTLEEVKKEYFDSYPKGAKEETTLKTEQVQLRKVIGIIGSGKAIAAMDVLSIEQYVRQRQKQNGLRGRKISPTTIRKELQALSQLWNFAEERGYVSGKNPVSLVKRPKPDAEEPFATYDEIAKRVAADPKMTAGRKAELWSGVFLNLKEVRELLVHIKANVDPMAHAALSFVAWTGCRRSEMMRATIDDVDLKNNVIHLREKKKTQKKSTTFRHVDIVPELRTVLVAWLKSRPIAGRYLFPAATGQALSPDQAFELFNRAVQGSKWEVIEGYHVLRHSLASNLASRGETQPNIRAVLGHVTEAMEARYRHMFPADRRAVMARLAD
jgi:integrase